MKYFNLIVLRKIFEYNNICIKSWYLKSAKICSYSFSTHSVDSFKENRLNSGNERLSWLALAGNGTKKPEDLIPKIIAEIEATTSFFRCVQEICRGLKHVFPDAEITVFGSAGSNLALRNADVDIGMHFKKFNKMSDELIHKIKVKLQKSRLFATTQAIYARVPIIKCVHWNGLSCDISFSNHLGAYDSELIRFILSIDNRIRPLILILKFLLKKEGLLFNTHCLIVMTVFFLQVLDNPLIPPICYLQDATTERKMFEGWNVSFTREINKLPKINNQLSISELLQKFFQFYAGFEFAFQVIAVFTGKFYLKPIFANAHLLPQEFQLFKSKIAENESSEFNCNTYMCIQGFFNHSANISKNFIEKNVKDFQDYCRTCAAIGQKLLQTDDSEEVEVQFLVDLFQQKKMKAKKGNSSGFHAVILMQNVSLQDVNSSADDLRNKWWKSVLRNILEILTDVMLCEVSVEFGKTEDDSGSLVKENIISCKMHYWELATKLRQKTGKIIDLPQDMTQMQKEKLISQYLKNITLENAEKTSYEFDVIYRFEKNPTRVDFEFKPKFKNDKTDGSMHQACSYMSKKIPKWLS